VRVLIVNNLYPPQSRGGAEKSVQILAEGLVRNGISVAVAHIAPQLKGIRVNTDDTGVRRYTLGNSNVAFPPMSLAPKPIKAISMAVDTYNPLMGAKIATVIHDYKPSVVHTNALAGFSLAAWVAAYRAGAPIVHTARDYYLLCYRGSMWSAGQSCLEQCRSCRIRSAPHRRSVAKYVSTFVGITKHVVQVHEEAGVLTEPLHRTVIYNSPGPTTSSNLPHRSPAACQRLRVGYLGRIEEKKGVEVLLSAALRLLRQDAPLCVRLAGHGDAAYVSQLKAKFRHPAIAFIGQADAGSFLSQLDVLVVPSLWAEPMGRVIVEAHAQGTPVLAAARGGMPELIRPDFNGWVYDATVEHLERHLWNLSRPDARKQVAEMRRQLRHESRTLTDGAMVAAYEGVYRRVRGQGQRRDVGR